MGHIDLLEGEKKVIVETGVLVVMTKIEVLIEKDVMTIEIEEMIVATIEETIEVMTVTETEETTEVMIRIDEMTEVMTGIEETSVALIEGMIVTEMNKIVTIAKRMIGKEGLQSLLK